MDVELPDEDWAKRLILRVEVGSTAYGTSGPDGGDYDEIGVMWTPWANEVGVPVPSQTSETIVYRPGRGDQEASQTGDYDLNVYSVRKFVSLATQGNPSLVVALFCPIVQANAFGRTFVNLAQDKAFWSLQARSRFLGYADSQRDKLQRGATGQKVKRPALVEEHGYDTKFAMHALRLAMQGVEFMETGVVQIPIPEPHGETLRQMRRGEFSLYEAVGLIDHWLNRLAAITDAPEHPQYDRINKWLFHLHNAVGPYGMLRGGV